MIIYYPLFFPLFVCMVLNLNLQWMLVTFCCYSALSHVLCSVSPYYKTKLKGLYTTAMQDAESEIE